MDMGAFQEGLFCINVKGWQAEGLISYGLIFDVEPLLAPPLDRLDELDLEVLDVLSSLHSKSVEPLGA